MTDIERKNLEWKSHKEDQEQVHKGLLVKNINQNFIGSISSFVDKLNNGETVPEFPEQYFNLDMGMVRALGLDKKLEFVVFNEEETKGTNMLVYPTESPIEYIASKTYVLVADRKNFLRAFEMFNLDSTKIDDFMTGYIQIKDDKWYVESLFDKDGWGYDKYKQELRILNCPVT